MPENFSYLYCAELFIFTEVYRCTMLLISHCNSSSTLFLEKKRCYGHRLDNSNLVDNVIEYMEHISFTRELLLSELRMVDVQKQSRAGIGQVGL